MPGAYLEFAERLVLPDFSQLPVRRFGPLGFSELTLWNTMNAHLAKHQVGLLYAPAQGRAPMHLADSKLVSE